MSEPVQLAAVDTWGSAWGEAVDDDTPLAWQEEALCAQTDPEAFFPEKGGSTREAKRICVGCTVKAECLEYALAHDERFGIWGGLSERERRRLKRLAG
ncbi:MAG: WhiB family transcriptional regulator [Actinomycetota bacterium]|nr:WhiB family transcriptional regulator [Actinomycetota bacterium]